MQDFILKPVQEKPKDFNFDKFLVEGKDFLLVKENTFEKIRSIIKKNPGKIIVFQASDLEDLNRKVLEKLEIQVFLSPEFNKEKDKLKQRSSGLNQVLCRIATKRDIAVGISLNKLIRKNLELKDNTIPLRRMGREQSLEVNNSKVLARIKQNIRLCRKYKTKMIVGSFAESKEDLRNALDIKSLFLTLGMSTQQLKVMFN